MLKCCQISTIVPNPLNRSRDSVHIIQQSLINVWQAHVRQWYRIDSIQYEHTVTHNVPDNPHSDPPSQNTIGDQPVIKRGHILRIIPSGGVFCVRCGKQTKYQKHARLKILNKQCAFLDLDPSHGLTSPGFNQPTNRSLEAEHQLNEKHNKAEHTPLWNRKLGKIQSKPDHGKLWCSSGGKSWPWSARASTLSKPRCHPSCQIPEGPSWVLQLDRYNPPSSHQSSHTVPQSAVRRRIAGKQSVTQTTSQTESVTSSGAAASSSTTVCRRGIS